MVDVELVTEVAEHRRHADLEQPPPRDVVLPEFEEVDLAAQVIRDEFRRLDVRRAGLDSLDVRKSLLDRIGDSTDPTVIDGALARYEEMRLRRAEVDAGLDRLQQQARALGYALATRSGQYVPFRDVRLEGTSGAHEELRKLLYPVAAGELYRVEWRQRTWVETLIERHRVTSRGFLGLWSSSWEIQIRREQTRAHRYLGWEPVLVGESPLLTRCRELEAGDESGARFQCFVFGTSDGNATTADGVTLQSVMQRCAIDEEFRRQCALLLPRYEQALTRGKVVVSYLIVKRPLPGFAPVGMPRLFLEEQLSYRTRWLGVELGELVHAVNLAPGETRKATVTRRFTVRQEQRRSVTSLLDITSSVSDDLMTEMENERARRRHRSWPMRATARRPI